MIRRAAVLPLIALLPGVLRAQQPGERAVLDSIQSAFAAQADTAALFRRERERVAVARVDRDNAMLHMELGYLAQRLGELTQVRQRYEDAASEFQWATDLQPGWPYAWHRLGLAELAIGEGRVVALENIRQLLGMDFLSRAARAFQRAIEADPTFSRAVVDLATTAMHQRVNAHTEIVQALLRQVVSGPAGRVREVQLMRGRIEDRMEAPDSALAAFQAYLALGGDTGLGGLEAARAEAQLDRRDSCRAWYYLALARPLSDSARHEARRDVRWIASPEELAGFDAAPADSIGAFLRGFWERRDAADGRRSGERLVEQLRRYHYAQVHYALASRRRRFDVTFAYSDSTQTDFDDRGVVYLRHGEPAERARYSAPGFDANESWLYHLGGRTGDIVLHFVAFGDVNDYRLMESLLATCRLSADYVAPLLRGDLAFRGNTLTDQATRQNTGLRDVSQCLQARAPFGDIYERLARAGGAASPNMWANERQATLAMVHAAITTDSYAHNYTASLRPVVSWFAVADPELRPELHLVFAVDATRLHPATAADGGTTWTLALRLLVSDSTTGRLVAALDTVRVFHSAVQLGPGSFLTEQMVLRVPAGRYRYAFVIEEPQAHAGDAVTRQPIDVPALAGAFAASDIVLGREGSGLVWHRQDGDVPLNPLMRYPRDGEVSLYYELYGLPLGAGVATRVRVAEAGGRSLFRRLFGGHGGADLEYRTVTEAAGRAVVRQHIGLAGLSPGRYTIQVELTDEAGGTRVVRSSPFEIASGNVP